jgi:uncharacterized damage-inducible protein DinB
MPMVDALLPEFDHEMSVTRKVLERVPGDKFEWKPHPKSMSFGALAQHVANLPLWGAMTLSQSELDLGGQQQVPAATSRTDLLAGFDQRVKETRALLAATSDAELMAPWTLKRDGHTIFSMPKAAVWRSFVLSHLIHHRAQLSVYLRLNDVPVPSMYGPSADEGAF